MYIMQIGLEDHLMKVFNRFRFLDTSSLPWEKIQTYNQINAYINYPGYNYFTMNCVDDCRHSTDVTKVPVF
jgi:hypothetical protein